MEVSEYYKILTNRINSLEISDQKRDTLQQKLDTLFTVMALKFLQLNIPPYLFTQFFNDLKALTDDRPVPAKTTDDSMAEFVRKYVSQIPDYGQRFKEFVADQSISSLMEGLEG
ncbi:hypothetical protein GF360_03995 [candidate division WWE3 bacterium]|nr:hypothetical protein [candidate division WWE3 bacterium]